MRFVKSLVSQKTFLWIVLLSFLGYSANLYYDYSKNLSTGTYRRLLTSYDVTSNTFLPYEIILNHRVNFGAESIEAMRAVEGVTDVHSIVKVGDKVYAGYPILAGLMALPFYYVPLILHKIPELNYAKDLLRVLVLGRIAATFYTSVSVGLFFLILKNLLRKLKIPFTKWVYVFTAFYAFGTNVYAIASRSLWQHTSSLLINSLIVLLLIYALDNPKIVKWLGLLCGLSFIARPTNVFLVLAVASYIFIEYRKEFLKFALLAGTMFLLLMFYNYSIFGSPFINEYVAREDTKFSTPLLVGLAGNLFSPSRSFLFITPPLVLSYFGIARLLAKKGKNETEKLLSYLSISFVLTLLMLSMWWCWWGADRFGYGFLTEWLPIAGAITFLVSLSFKSFAKIVLIILMVYSLYTQVNAVWFRKSRCGQDRIWSFYCVMPVLEKQGY